jgi:pimeloyl-ACP methyl ester carboxylesterase
MPFLERDGARLYYETHGAGPALVFVHGLGGGHLSWWQQVPHFRDRFTCVTFDHRGFGLSGESPAKPGPDAYVDDLAALVDHLELPDVRLSPSRWAAGRAGYALRHRTA